jgi:hypothetical protein
MACPPFRRVPPPRSRCRAINGGGVERGGGERGRPAATSRGSEVTASKKAPHKRPATPPPRPPLELGTPPLRCRDSTSDGTFPPTPLPSRAPQSPRCRTSRCLCCAGCMDLAAMAGEEDWRSKLDLPAKDLRIRTEVRAGRGVPAPDQRQPAPRAGPTRPGCPRPRRMSRPRRATTSRTTSSSASS